MGQYFPQIASSFAGKGVLGGFTQALSGTSPGNRKTLLWPTLLTTIAPLMDICNSALWLISDLIYFIANLGISVIK